MRVDMRVDMHACRHACRHVYPVSDPHSPVPVGREAAPVNKVLHKRLRMHLHACQHMFIHMPANILYTCRYHMPMRGSTIRVVKSVYHANVCHVSAQSARMAEHMRATNACSCADSLSTRAHVLKRRVFFLNTHMHSHVHTCPCTAGCGVVGHVV